MKENIDFREVDSLISYPANQALACGNHAEFGEVMLNKLDDLRRDITMSDWVQTVIPHLREQRFYKISQEDPFSRRSTTRPRGYAGDAVLVDFLYRSNDIGNDVVRCSATGQAIFNYWINSPAARSVRRRRDYFESQIIRTIMNTREARILVLASGHFREGEIPLASGCFEKSVVFCLDQDAESCSHVIRRFGQSVTILNRNVTSVLRMNDEFDLIYAAGLYDYLNDTFALRLNSKLVSMLRRRGRSRGPEFSEACTEQSLDGVSFRIGFSSTETNRKFVLS